MDYLELVFVRSRVRPALATLGLVAAVALVACGSDEVTQEDYRAATGAVCAKYQKTIEADQARVDRLGANSDQNPEPFVAAVRKFQRNWDRFAAALKAVEQPPEDRQELKRFFATLTTSRDRVADLASTVDQLPGLAAEAEAVEQSQDRAQAEALIARAEDLQSELQRTEAGFEQSIAQVERFVNRYPGLADCR